MVPICDGSDRVRLAVFVTGGGPSSSELMPEVGFSYLYVDAACRYAVNLGDWQGPTHGGVLDAARSATLSARLSYGRWPELVGDYRRPAFDAGALVFDSGRLDRPEITCSFCEGLSEDIDRVVSGYEAEAASLHAEGQELDGPVRFIVWTGSEGPFPVVDASGSPIDFAALAVPPGTLDPAGHVTGTAAEAASLRALRAATLADPTSRNLRPPYLTVRDGAGGVFRVEIRDVLPMEGPDHRVRLR